MINEFIYLAIPAVISLFMFVSIRIKLRTGTSVSYYKIFADQERLNGLLLISAPAFTAFMGLICLISGGNLGLLMLGVQLSLISLVLFVVGSAISSVLCVKGRTRIKLKQK